ncbi:UNVERIFIED_CONTAM: hypothetical protein PYX00_001239 [Menopon gallinae]|uniref:RING-type E3 ubiquitin transferase n=1 Tax=Menopon gallinae TaxID=328185 RepID=A0AAW2ICT9_9NEOP
MSEENPDLFSDSNVEVRSHGVPENPDILWVVNQDERQEGHEYPEAGGGVSIVLEDSGSETDYSNRTEDQYVNTEVTDSSDTEITLSPLPRNTDWEPPPEGEGDEALNVHSVIIIERESEFVQEPSVVSMPENPNAGVENPIIRLENPDYEPVEEVTDSETSRVSNKRSYSAMISEDDDGQTCPVCLDVWTNAGAHRLCSLKCGHLFGKSCITRWLITEKKKYCPQCNKRALQGDIRDLYASKLTVVDSSEKVRLEQELEEVKKQKKELEIELLKSRMTLESYIKQMDVLKQRVALLEGNTVCEKKALLQKPEAAVPNKIKKFHLEKTFGIQEGSCRVSAFSPLNNILIVSQQIRNQPFRGFGVKKISKNGMEFHSHAMMIHKKALRDMSYHPVTPNLLLTVSFDKSAKLTNIEENRTIQTFQTEQPLWSCCWDHDDPNIFYAGAGNGLVTVYDIRRQSEPVANLSPTEDFGAVVALRYAPGGRAVICCRLNSVVYYEKVSPTEYNAIPVPGLVGPFFSLSYNSETQHLLVSCRPSLANPTVRHVYCEMNGTSVNKLFAFHGGTRQTLLCRSCFITAGDESLCAVFQENTNSVELWSTSTFSRFQSIPVNDHILDLISIKTDNRNFLGTVSDTMVRFFEGPS